MAFSVGERVSWQGMPGTVTRIPHNDKRVAFVRFGDGDTELFFTVRRDGVYRLFPGPADGTGLRAMTVAEIAFDTKPVYV